MIDIDNAEGKYNIVLKNTKQPGRERVRAVAKVGVDTSPPEITYEILKTATGRNTDKLKVTVRDPQTGVVFSETKIENIPDTANIGLPQVIKETRTEKNTRTKQVLIFNLKNPEMNPTDLINQITSENIASTSEENGFRITSESPSIEHEIVRVDVKNEVNLSGFQIAKATVSRQSINLSGTCSFGNGATIQKFARLYAAFDLDRVGAVTRNITLIFQLNDYARNGYGSTGGDYFSQNGQTVSASGTKWIRSITVNGRNDLVLSAKDRGLPTTSEDIRKFNKDELTDICYGAICSPASSVANDHSSGQAYLHMAVKMNDLADATQVLGISIPSRTDPSRSIFARLKIDRSTKSGENWSSIECL